MGKSHIPPVPGSIGDLASSDGPSGSQVPSKQVQIKEKRSHSILIDSDTEFSQFKSKPPIKKPRMPKSKKSIGCSSKSTPIDDSSDEFSDP